MATDLERLVVSLEASITKYDRAMAKAVGTANNTSRKIERRFKKMNGAVSASLTRLGSFFVGGAALRGAQQLIDASTRIENSLKVAGLAGDELTHVYERLFESAQKNAAPVEALTKLYGRAALVQNELGISTEELLGFTDKVAVALRVSGQSAQESSGALLQLSQALGSGVVRAEEFNSILEGALPIAQAAAAGLKEAGGSVAKLRQLVVDGKVSSEAFFRAFEAGSVILDEKVASSELTVSQGFVRLQNVLTDTAGKLNKAIGASVGATDALSLLGDALQAIGDDNGPVITALQNTSREIGNVTQAAKDFWENPSARNAMRFLLGEDMANLATPGQTVNRVAKGDRAAAMSREEFSARFGGGGSQVKSVSLADYAPPATSKTGTGTKARENAFARELRQMQEQTAELRLQFDLVGKTDRERDRASAILELENAARRAGITLTDTQRRQVESLADAYADAAESVRLAEDRFQALNDLQREFGDLAIDGIMGLIDGTKTLNDVLADTLKRLGEMALQAAILGDGPLASLFGSKSSSGGVGGLIGALFGGFRAAGGPVKSGRAYVVGEKQPEVFVPNQNGTIIPKVPTRAASGSNVTINQHLTFQNVDPTMRPWIMAQLQQVRQESVAAATVAVRSGRRNNPGYFG